MGARLHDSKKALFEPIPAKIKAEWDELIETSKAIVKQNDNSRWKLLLISSEVGKRYGDSLIERWALEIGISIRSAREYRQLAGYGISEIFIKEWSSKLTYTQIRYFVLKHKSVPHALPYLQDMYDRKLRQDEIWAKEAFTVVTDKEVERVKDELKPVNEKLEQSVAKKLISEEAALQFTKLLERIPDPEIINSMQHHVLVDDELLTEYTDSLKDKNLAQLHKELVDTYKQLSKLYSYILQNKNKYEMLLALHLETSVKSQSYSSSELHAKIEKLSELMIELASIEPEPIMAIEIPVPAS